jgi:hypothetical protein
MNTDSNSTEMVTNTNIATIKSDKQEQVNPNFSSVSVQLSCIPEHTSLHVLIMENI